MARDRNRGATSLSNPAAEPDAAPHPKSSFVGNAGVTFAGLIIGAILSALNEILAARFLGVAGYGDYAIGLMLAKGGEILATFGLSFGLLHFLPVHLRRDETGLALGSILGAAAMPVVFGGALALLLAASSRWLAVEVFHDPRLQPFLAALGCAIPIYALADVIGSAARGFGYPLPYIAMRAVVPGLLYALALLLLIRIDGPPLAAPYVLLAAATAGLVGGSVWFARMVRRRIGLPRPVLRLRALYGFSVPVLLHLLISLGLGFTDLFLLGVLRDVEMVGVYRACTQVVLAFDLVLNAVSAASAPLFPVMIAERHWAALAATYQGAVRLATLLAIPGLLLILANADDILAVLGPRFVPGAFPLTILAIGFFAKTVLGTAGVLLVVGGRQMLEVRNGLVAAGLNLALALVLIPRFGLQGAAISTATALVVLTGLRLRQVRVHFGLYSVDRHAWLALLLAVVATLAISLAAAACGIGPGTGFGHLASRLLLLGIVLATLLLNFGVPVEERMKLQLPWRRRAARPTDGNAEGSAPAASLKLARR